MYANIVFIDQHKPELENEVHEDALVENPVVPSEGSKIVLKGVQWIVRQVEWDYDVFWGDREYGQIHVAIIVRMTKVQRTDIRGR